MLGNHSVYVFICTKGWTSAQSTTGHALERGNIYIIIYNVYIHKMYTYCIIVYAYEFIMS